jgi:hypothetical protein
MTLIAFLSVTVVVGTWLGIRAAQVNVAFRRILAAPIPTEDDE